MTEEEKDILRKKKAEAVAWCQAQIKDLDRYACILDTDPRLRQYVEGVLGDPENHNLYELLGLRKFFRLREKGHKWNIKRVRHFLHTWELFTYVDESGARKVKLSPYQVFVFANIFGWAQCDGRRLIRDVVIECPRKLGKTTMTAGLCAYELMFGPADAQAYVGSNSYQQSKILFDMLRMIVKEFDPHEKVSRVNREKIYLDTDHRHSTATALSDSPKRLDGLNASLVVMDEYSQARNTETKSGASLKNVLTSSMTARTEPLTVIITTASEVLDGPFYNDLQNILAMLRGDEDDDDTMFATIFQPDVDDDFADPNVWKKVHPHMDVTVRLENYEAEYKKALRSAEDMLTFKTKLLNIFCVNEQEAWIPASLIADKQREFDLFKPQKGKYPCCIGIDLSVRDDFSVVTYMVYDSYNKRFLSQSQYFIPSETLERHRNSALYKVWAEKGYLTVIPGDINDTTVIANTIIDKARNCKHLNIMRIGYDPYKALDCVNTLKAWLQSRGLNEKAVSTVIQPVPQSIGQFNLAVETFELSLSKGMFFHGPDPITPWCFGNAVLMFDTNDNRKPVKKVQHMKIDSTITNCMAIKLFYDIQN